MLRQNRIAGLYVLIATAGGQIAHGELVIENINFLERVSPSGGGGHSQSTFFEFPSSPNHIVFSQKATIPPSFSTGTYDLWWSGDSAHFQSSIDHHLEGFVGGLISNGSIRFRPAVDSFVTLTGTWTYNHAPGQIGRTIFGMRVGEPGPTPDLWFDQKRGGTEFLLPPSGTLNLSGSAVLQAGILYSVGYNISTDNLNPPPASATWLGTGLIDITIAPVPEPATLTILAPALCLFIARRTRSRARPG